MSKDIKSLINLLIKKFEAGQFQEVIEKSIIVLKKMITIFYGICLD